MQHTSLSGFSTCTAEAIHAYFANGTLPAPGTLCQTDTVIFENPSNSSAQGGVTFPKRIALDGEAETFEEAAVALRGSDFMMRNSLMRRARRATSTKSL